MSEATKHGGHSAAGASILELLESKLDDAMDNLMSSQLAGKDISTAMHQDSGGWAGHNGAWQTHGELRGQAQGLALAVATMMNPYDPQVEAIKVGAYSRWQERQAK